MRGTCRLSHGVCCSTGFFGVEGSITKYQKLMLRLLLTPRWVGYVAITVVFAVITSLFGSWQWDRREQALSEIRKIESNYDRVPISLDEFMERGDKFVDQHEWTPLVVTGQYLDEQTVLVRTRPRSGAVGFEVLVPFISQGETIIVNRGWIPSSSNAALPTEIPPPPEDALQVVGSVRSPEPIIKGRGAPEGQVSSINLGVLQDQLAANIREDFFLDLRDEIAVEQVAPLKPERPELDEGPHLSYSFQWYLFGAMAVIGLLHQLRHAARDPKKSSKKRALLGDSEEEDAILDGYPQGEGEDSSFRLTK